ncbi:MAG: phosphate acyltransferase PlsX [Thermotogae bacterium]|nr:phosphate acyltransferase PlsX [Thermotogota bacterium]
MRVALDAFGTDNAPLPEIRGALKVLEEDRGVEVVLVGDVRKIREYLPTTHPRLSLVDAKEVVHHHDKPSEVLKKRPKSSMAVAMDLVRRGEADAFISAGNTGAVMAYALRKLGRIKGVKRPAIGALFPNINEGRTLVLDMGANIHVSSDLLVQFGIMGAAFYNALFHRHPRLALLNIGEEEQKGGEVIVEARRALERMNSHYNFVGYVEGHEILSDKADVIVMDGFVGNVLLKFGESVLSTILEFIKREVKGNPRALLGAMLLKPAFKAVRKKADFEEYGGAPLIGVNGIVIIAHGRSSARAIHNAILVAKTLHQHDLLNKTRRYIEGR